MRTDDTSSLSYHPLVRLEGASRHAEVRDLRAVLLPLRVISDAKGIRDRLVAISHNREIADTRLSLEKLPPALTYRVKKGKGEEPTDPEISTKEES